jgi:recombination protein RecA
MKKTREKDSSSEAEGLMGESQAWNYINDLFGDDTVFHPDEVERVEAFTTRSPALDRALQVGGWGRGRIYQMAGKPSSGKTFMALVSIAEWQSKDPQNCACFIDAEYTYDPDWAASLGVDNDRVLLIKTNDGQKIFNGLLGKPKKNKNTGEITPGSGLLDMIKKKQAMTHTVKNKKIRLELGKLGVIVLDSIAVIQPPQEAESAAGKVNVAPLPRFLGPELRKLTPAVAKANVCFIAINHVKEKIGEMYGNPETTPGGAAWKHACSVMLMVAPLGGPDNVLMDSNSEKYGHKIKIKVEKNKLGKPYKTAEFFIDFTSGVAQREDQLLELSCLYDIIKRPNNLSYIIDNEKINSRASVLKYIKENEHKIEELVRAQYLNGEGRTLPGEGSPEEFTNPFEAESEAEGVDNE